MAAGDLKNLGRLFNLETLVPTLKQVSDKRLKEVAEGKSHAQLEKGICHIQGREKVQNVIIDLSDSYTYFVKDYFPIAKIVADKFHVLRLLNPAINRKRIGITGDKRTLGIRRLLLRNGYKLDFLTKARIRSGSKTIPNSEKLMNTKKLFTESIVVEVTIKQGDR